jgi:Cof subfamily protein (haloacid dehalogenase superfamily)
MAAMGNFQGIMLISDIDGTLLADGDRVGARNAAAIRRFQAAGGRFTLATGRMPSSMARFLGEVELNAPAICYNGAAIHDHGSGRTLWRRELETAAGEVLDHVMARFPDTGIELYSGNGVFFCQINDLVAEHLSVKGFPRLTRGWREVPPPWIKALFIQTPDRTAELRQHLLATGFAAHYQFVQSGDIYYELLPPGTSKGRALVELARLCGQDLARTIAVGDNENDIDMLRTAGLGIAVDNAAQQVKDHADRVTVHHEAHAIHQIIEELEAGLIRI